MDAACATSALVGLIFNCATAVKTCNDLLGKYRNAPQTLSSIETEVSTLEASLLQLQHLMLRDRAALASRWDIKSLLPQTFETAIDSFKKMFSVLLADLDRINEKKRNSADSRISWGWKVKLLWNEAAMQDLLTRIRAHQQSLQFLMTILQMGSISDIRRGIRENQELLRSLERASRKRDQEYRDSEQQEASDSGTEANEEPPAKRRSLSPEEDDQLSPIPGSAQTRSGKVFRPSIEGRALEEDSATTPPRRRKSKSSTPRRDSRGSTPLRETPDPKDQQRQGEGYFGLGRFIRPISSDWSSSFKYSEPVTSIETGVNIQTKGLSEKSHHSRRRHRSHTSGKSCDIGRKDRVSQHVPFGRYPTPESEPSKTSIRRESPRTPSSNYSITGKGTFEASSSMRTFRGASGLYSPPSTASGPSRYMQSPVNEEDEAVPETLRESRSPHSNICNEKFSDGRGQRSIDESKAQQSRDSTAFISVRSPSEEACEPGTARRGPSPKHDNPTAVCHTKVSIDISLGFHESAVGLPGHAAYFPFSDDDSPIATLFDDHYRDTTVDSESDMENNRMKDFADDSPDDANIQEIPCDNTYPLHHQSLGTSTTPVSNPNQPIAQPSLQPQGSRRNLRSFSKSTTAAPKPNPTREATEADALRHRLPPGYSLKNWDPTEEPILLLGSVFDANSLGKWIYDWTVYHHGPATPLADMAGELWLLLIQLAGKIKRSEECIDRIRSQENREMVDDFIESGERLTNKLKKLLKACENPMLKAGMKRAKGSQLGKNAGTEFVDSIFGRERELDSTEKFMSSVRLWNLRFDANCEDVLRRPGQ